MYSTICAITFYNWRKIVEDEKIDSTLDDLESRKEVTEEIRRMLRDYNYEIDKRIIQSDDFTIEDWYLYNNELDESEEDKDTHKISIEESNDD